MATTNHHRVLIIGGGAAGISVASRLKRKIDDVAVIEPSDRHFYQPLWTLVGGGCAKVDKTVRAESSVMPKGVTWLRASRASCARSALTKLTRIRESMAPVVPVFRMGFQLMLVVVGGRLFWMVTVVPLLNTYSTFNGELAILPNTRHSMT